jgi:hypothetical protein
MYEKKIWVQQEICTKLLIVYVYFQPNSCNTHAEREWAQGTFLRQRRKVPPAHAQQVFFIKLPGHSKVGLHTPIVVY